MARNYSPERKAELSIYKLKWKRENPILVKASYERCKEKVNAERREQYAANPSLYLKRNAQNILRETPTRREQRLARNRAYSRMITILGTRKKISPERRMRVNEWRKIRIERDINFRLKERLRARVRKAVQLAGGQKAARTMQLIGCSVEFLKGHLQSRFTDGMSWGNIGAWHIDHIIPCVEYDLRDENQQKQCFHYSNLRPLWARDNRIKGARLIAAGT